VLYLVEQPPHYDLLRLSLSTGAPEQFGIDREHFFNNLQVMAEQALASGSPGNNPRVPSADEIIQIYRKLW
jgi:alcohol dehydrogenase class IV